MRRITASLEALSAYGTLQGAPRAGRLVEDVDPPGFDALAALVPRVGDGSPRSVRRARCSRFRRKPKAPAKGKTRSADDAQAEGEAATGSNWPRHEPRSRKPLAQSPLRSRVAQHAQNALKKAATHAKETEDTMVATEARLQKVASLAHEARQKARRAAVEAESAAQAVEEAERSAGAERRESCQNSKRGTT